MDFKLGVIHIPGAALNNSMIDLIEENRQMKEQ